MHATGLSNCSNLCIAGSPRPCPLKPPTALLVAHGVLPQQHPLVLGVLRHQDHPVQALQVDVVYLQRSKAHARKQAVGNKGQGE